MTLFWDTHWCLATGIIAAMIGHLFRRDRGKYNIYAFVAGLIFCTSLMYGAVWLFLEVDPNWMVNYFYVPELSSLGWVILYPMCYILGFLVTMGLIRIGWDRWWMLLFSIWWIIFTIILTPRFYLVYGTTPTPEWFWEITRTTDNFFFLPIPTGTSLGPFFLFLFIGSFLLHGGMVIYGFVLVLLKSNCHQPSLAINNPYCYIPEKISK